LKVKYSIPTFAEHIYINASTFSHTKNNLKTNSQPLIKITKKLFSYLPPITRVLLEFPAWMINTSQKGQ